MIGYCPHWQYSICSSLLLYKQDNLSLKYGCQSQTVWECSLCVLYIIHLPEKTTQPVKHERYYDEELMGQLELSRMSRLMMKNGRKIHNSISSCQNSSKKKIKLCRCRSYTEKQQDPIHDKQSLITTFSLH